MTPQSLAKRLNRTLLDLTKQGEKLFDWWPRVPHRTLKKNGFRDVKAIVLSYKEAGILTREGFDCAAEPLEISTDVPETGHEPLTIPRPCIVSIMGHVDHGKTTLMDRIRGGSIALHEAGGITQDTYCFIVDVDGNATTFLDTPGHRVFTSMRDNAAFLSDLAVLIVDVNEGVRPQTLESIAFAIEYKLPLLPVISKVDNGTESDIEASKSVRKVGKEIKAAINTVVAESVHAYPETLLEKIEPLALSAKTGWNLDKFEREITSRLTSLTMQADANAPPYGAVIEAFRENTGRGNVATVVLWQGCMRTGDNFVTGSTHGKIKQILLSDETRALMTQASPGVPVQIMGLNKLPEPGDDFIILDEEEVAVIAEERECEERYEAQERVRGLNHDEPIQFGGEDPPPLESVAEDDHDDDDYPVIEDDTMLEDGLDAENFELGSIENPHLVIVRADKQGTLQPLLRVCEEPFAVSEGDGKLEVHVKVLDGGVGPVTKADVQLASAAGASLQCFRVKPPSKQTAKLINQLRVEVNYFDVYFDFLRNIGLTVE